MMITVSAGTNKLSFRVMGVAHKSCRTGKAQSTFVKTRGGPRLTNRSTSGCGASREVNVAAESPLGKEQAPGKRVGSPTNSGTAIEMDAVHRPLAAIESRLTVQRSQPAAVALLYSGGSRRLRAGGPRFRRGRAALPPSERGSSGTAWRARRAWRCS